MCSDSITTPLTFFILRYFCVLYFAWVLACDARLPWVAILWDLMMMMRAIDIWHFGHRIHTDYDVLTRGRTVWNVVKPCYDFMDLESRKYRFIMTILAFWVGLDCMWGGVGTSRVQVLPAYVFPSGGGCERVTVGLPVLINAMGHLGLMGMKCKFRTQ